MVVVFGFPKAPVLIDKEGSESFPKAWEEYKSYNNVVSRSQIRYGGTGTVINSSNQYFYVLRHSPFGNIVLVINRSEISERDNTILEQKKAIIGGVFELVMEKVIPHTVHNPNFAESLRYSFATDKWNQKSIFFTDERIEFDLQKIGIPGIEDSFSGLRTLGNYLHSVYPRVTTRIIGIDTIQNIIDNSGTTVTIDKLKLLVLIDKTPKYVFDIVAGLTRIEKVVVHDFVEYKDNAIVIVKEYGEE